MEIRYDRNVMVYKLIALAAAGLAGSFVFFAAGDGWAQATRRSETAVRSQTLPAASLPAKPHSGPLPPLPRVSFEPPRSGAVLQQVYEFAARHPEVVWLAINSTAKGHPDFVEPAAYTKFLQRNAIGYPVLYDTSGEVGRAYGADTTPDMFVVDEQGKLIYAGAIDDDPSGRKSAAARQNYVDAALTQHEAGQAVATTTTRSYGCTVKY